MLGVVVSWIALARTKTSALACIETNPNTKHFLIASPQRVFRLNKVDVLIQAVS